MRLFLASPRSRRAARSASLGPDQLILRGAQIAGLLLFLGDADAFSLQALEERLGLRLVQLRHLLARDALGLSAEQVGARNADLAQIEVGDFGTQAVLLAQRDHPRRHLAEVIEQRAHLLRLCQHHLAPFEQRPRRVMHIVSVDDAVTQLGLRRIAVTGVTGECGAHLLPARWAPPGARSARAPIAAA